MQELYHLIKLRFDRVKLMNGTNITNDQYNKLREEQKSRCEKETWILSMFRSKKNLTPGLKQNYFAFSYSIMQVIEPSFKYEQQPLLTQQTFLNDFVCLYTQFFDQYQKKFNFKIRVRNLLRPTNHNVINDLIKYLADFSRDYSQHIYFWQLKSSRKIVTESSIQTPMHLSQPHPEEEEQGGQPSSQMRFSRKKLSKDRPSLSLKKSSNSDVLPENKKKPESGEDQPAKKLKEFNRLYGILDLQPQSGFVLSEKTKTSFDVLKLKINEMYRQAKWRNSIIKKSLSDYYSYYYPSGNNSSRQTMAEETIKFPIKISLSVEKNGFSCLIVGQNEQKVIPPKETKDLSPVKDRKASSLSNRELVQPQNSRTHNDFMLNSLKILRVSQNFLPPLISGGSTKNTEQSVRKQGALFTNERKASNFQNMINMEIMNERDFQSYKKDGMIYYNQQLAREAERKKAQKRRISEMRKHFISQEKMKQTRRKMNDPEEKIVEWMDKINMMKQLERKKIMGLT